MRSICDERSKAREAISRRLQFFEERPTSDYVDELPLRCTQRDSGDLNVWIDLLEQLLAAAQHKKQEYDLLNAGYMRLQIALERVVGKRTIEATFAD